MPRVNTRDFLTALEDLSAEVEVMGFDDGRFCLLAHRGDETLVHCNNDGSIKHYSHIEDVFDWIRRATGRARITVNLANWQRRPSRSRR
jgi:hypothetical protein